MEEQKLKGVDELEAMKAKMENARRIASAEAAVHIAVGIAPGMTVPEVVDQVEEDGEQEREDGADPLPPKKMPERKTKQQRKKAEKLRAEVRCSSPRFRAFVAERCTVETRPRREGGAEADARIGRLREDAPQVHLSRSGDTGKTPRATGSSDARKA